MFCSCFIADCPYIMPQVKTGWLIKQGSFTFLFLEQLTWGNLRLEIPYR